MNTPYRGSYRFYNPKLGATKIKCTVHDNPYINKKEMKCVIGILKKQLCKVELGGKDGGSK